jgi:predicted RNase H-like HicB family nuclease
MTTKFTYWQEGDGKILGYLNDFPDHWTQGESLQDLKDHLRDLYETFSEGTLPGIKKVAELELA